MQSSMPRRSVRIALLIGAICTVFLMIGGSAGAEPPIASPVEYAVEAGDTLWGIASQFGDPGVDLRRLVADIGRANDLGDVAIHPGQVLLIPRG